MGIRLRTMLFRAAATAAAFAVSLALAGAAAELLGWNEVGVIERGRYADFVAVGGDPLADITLIERPSIVIRAGAIVLDRR